VTEGFKDSCDTAHAAVLKVGGGETWGGVFNALAADGRFEASSGAAVTVGASGGWLQGGGLGPLDRQLGLGIDNAVQFEVVTADGSLKTADACTEPDLFWALRGGGGGNWGVVVSSTSKVHPKKPMVRVRIGWFGTPAFGQPPASQAPIGMELPLPASILMDPAGLKANKTAVFGDTQSNTLERWHEAMLGVMNPATMDDRFDGYYGTGCSWLGFACADGYFRGTMAELEEVVLKELRTVLQMTKQGNGAVGDAFFYSAMESASFYDYASQDCVSATAGSPQAYICNQIGYPSANGYNTDSQLGAGVYGTQLVWLVPSSLFTTEKPKMRELLKTPYGRLMIGHIIGGQVSRPAATDTAINPAVRTSAMHFILPTAFDANSPSMENVRAFIGQFAPPPQSAPCFNHDAMNLAVLGPLGADHGGLDWMQLYWGANLPRLKTIKAKYDPQEIFTCRDCVCNLCDSSYSDPTTLGKTLGSMSCDEIKTAFRQGGCSKKHPSDTQSPKVSPADCVKHKAAFKSKSCCTSKTCPGK